VEGLLDDIDFKGRVSRVQFESLCADLFERVSRPVQDALATAEMTVVSSKRPPPPPVIAHDTESSHTYPLSICEPLLNIQLDLCVATAQNSVCVASTEALQRLSVLTRHFSICRKLKFILSVYVFCKQDSIEQVILVGGATRVPKVQEVLLKAVNK